MYKHIVRARALFLSFHCSHSVRSDFRTTNIESPRFNKHIMITSIDQRHRFDVIFNEYCTVYGGHALAGASPVHSVGGKGRNILTGLIDMIFKRLFVKLFYCLRTIIIYILKVVVYI